MIEHSTDIELDAAPYTLCIDPDRGAIVRLPDGVEGFFSCTIGMETLLEVLGGRRWWQANGARVREEIAAPRVAAYS